jgi:hypothetical protein
MGSAKSYRIELVDGSLVITTSERQFARKQVDLIRCDGGHSWNRCAANDQSFGDVPITELNICVSHVG